MSKWPDCFPEDFEERILNPALPAECRDIAVYRVCKSGSVTRDDFLSSHEEYERKMKPMSTARALDYDDSSHYATSCFCSKKEAISLLKLMRRGVPRATLAAGYTKVCCGPSRLTPPRPGRKKGYTSHVDWWVYQSAMPQNHFALEMEEGCE